ncbi:MAG: YvcK family protein [Fimbriimonadaceae bacterium]|nr:YvcK family protein [Fimbriimonadaceae bacterium]
MINRHRLRRLLAPAAGFRNALATAVVGFLLFVVGTALSFRIVILPLLDAISRMADGPLQWVVPADGVDVARHFLGGGLLLLGAYLFYLGIRASILHVVKTINPDVGSKMADLYFRRQQLAHGPRVVALGGGTGLSTLLRGLKHHTSNITAIVTVTDDGGSSGKLVQEKGMIPPGDIRNCLVALSDAETSMTTLFQHRFTAESGSLSGHSLGNLFLAGLVDQAAGDFEKAIHIASEVLAIRGRVVPSTLSHVGLCAIFDDGSQVCGETKIVESRKSIRRVYLEPPDCAPHPEALEAIKNADLICIGPGSVYTSVIPNLLVPGIAEALRDSDAVKVYVCNVMTQRGESDDFSASEHVRTIQLNVEHRIFDCVLVNIAAPNPDMEQKYASSGQVMVDPDIDRIRAMGFKVVTGDLISESDTVRHDPMKAGALALGLLNR